MDLAHFNDSSPGKLVKNLDGKWAFVPNPLPGKVHWTERLISAVAEAEASLGRLSGLGERFPDPQRLVRLFLHREAELSSRIENTFADVRTQLLFEVTAEIERNAPDVLEVENNFRALESGLSAIPQRPISLQLIKQMHQLLLAGVRGQDKTPGEFRRVQAHIGRSNDIDEARFVPPPPSFVTDCMEQLEQFLQRDKLVPRVARLAMIHYQFEAIHPFADGNGRIGRVLILLLMCQTGMLPLPLFNPSAYLESNRLEYYDHLLRVSQRGAWAEWIEFFAAGIIRECVQVSRRIEALEELRRSYQDRVRTRRSSANLARLIDMLFAHPRVQLDDVVRLMDVWPASAQRMIDRLLAMEILKEVTGRQRNRIYLAREIIEVFSEKGRH